MHWAVIVAGGSGTRFWPLSTPAVPKQVLPLLAGRSTIEAAVERLDGLVPRDRVLLVTGPALAPALNRLLRLPAENILVEPAPKSTGPALVWGTREALRRDPEAVVLTTHADWSVPDVSGFRHAAEAALDMAARGDWLVTVGVAPTRPETGYGYVVPGDPADGGVRVTSFVEKPTAERAAALIADGARWNSGIFAWRAAHLMAEVAARTPELATALPALDAGDVPGFFDGCREVSIDVGLLERSPSVAMVPGDFAWDDIGTWDALRRAGPVDAEGNWFAGPVAAVESHDNVVWSGGTPVVLAWVRDLVVVEANGRILVLDRRRAADLKVALGSLPPSLVDIGGPQ